MRRKRIDHEFIPQDVAACGNLPPVILVRSRKRSALQLLLFCVAVLVFSRDGLAAETCLSDTSQAQFQLGILTNVAVLPPGDVVLASNATVDQQNTNLSSSGLTFHSYHWFGQTFKAGVSGPLSAVDIRLFCNSCTGTMPDITVSIRATQSGVPVGDDLAAATIPGFTSAGGQYFKATFASPLNVSAGTVYAILVRASSLPTTGTYAYLVSSADPYSDGARLTSTTSGVAWGVRDYDVGFRTYIGSGYVSSGNLVSSLKDSNPPSGSTPTWSTLSWDATVPGNTDLRFQAAASNSSSGPFTFVGPDGTAGTFFNSSGANLNQFNGSRYLKYKALLSNTSPAATPVLKDATVCHDNVTVSSADLQLTKTNGATTSTPGSQTTYTLVASNAGPSNVSSATVTDTFNANLQNCSWTCSGAGGGSCSASGGGNINQTVNLPAGASATFVAQCLVSPSATGSLVNTASISSATVDPVPGNNSATDTDTLAASANLSISKTNNVTTSTPGAQTTYTLVASNAGPSNVSSATVSDTFNANLQNCSWTCSSAGGASCGSSSGNGNINQNVNLPVSGSVSYSASCTIAAAATGSLVNTASVSSATTDPVPGNNSATDTDTLGANANLGITKTNGVSTSTPGSQTTYTLVASNAGPSNVASATVADTFNSNLENCSWTCSGSAGGSCPASGSGNINATVGLPSGGSATFVASCGVKSSATGSLVNTATISSATADPAAGNNSATDTDTLAASANLGITKTNGVSTSTPGSQTTYTLVASNAGPSNVASATVADTFNSNLENCSWTCSGSAGGSCPASGSGNINATVGLPSGASATFVASCTIKSSATGSLVNTATVSSATADPVAGNNSATDTDTLGANANLGITKTNGVTTSTPGSQTTYTIVASNAGPSNVASATVADTFNANLENCSWTCSGSAGGSCPASGSGNINATVGLPSGGSATFVASCTIKSSATGSLVNTATISSATADPVAGNNSATDSDTLAANANLGITKTNGATTSTPGSQTSYTIVASNAGPSNVASATVADTFNANLENCSWTCSGSAGGSCPASGSGNINATVGLPSGGSTTFVASCTIKSSATGSLVNTATVSSATADPVAGNNSATDTDTLGANANLGITKTNGVTTSTPGSQTSYTIVASNAGPSNVASATVADTFNANLENCSWTCSGSAGGSCPASGSGNINASVGLPSGGSTTFVASCTIKSSATGSLVNTATISSATADPVAGNNSATDTDTLAASANLGITKTNNVTTSTPGAQTTYILVASNAGPSNVSSATVSDTFNANLQSCSWTCSSAGGASCGTSSGTGNINRSVNLPVNGSVSFSATCTVAASATGSLVNTASISSAIVDPVPGNNSATDTDTLPGTADLSITVGNEESTVIAGSSVIYTIVAANAGPTLVNNATVSDVFPAKLENCEWLCNASAGASCAAAGAGNINQSVNLPANGNVTFTAICDVDESATGTLVNTATIASVVSDPAPGNNSATDTDTLSYLADLRIVLTAGSTSSKAGSPLTYTIVASNAGSSSVNQATVKNIFPPELNSCSWSCQGSAGASCPVAGSGHIDHPVSLPRDSQVTYTATCVISPQATGSLVNTAEVTSAINDPDPGNNQAVDVISLEDEVIFRSGFD